MRKTGRERHMHSRQTHLYFMSVQNILHPLHIVYTRVYIASCQQSTILDFLNSFMLFALNNYVTWGRTTKTSYDFL